MAISIVLADDHQIIRDGINLVLSGETEFEVVGQAENGRECIELVRRLAPDLVVMDISMPDLNGIDATQKIKEMEAGCKVLALSGHKEASYIQGMLKAGAAGYLLKNSAMEEVVTAIQTIAAGNVYISPAIASVVVGDYVSHLSGETAVEEEPLSSREREVIQLIAEGQSTAEIASKLNVSVKTVETHRKNIMDKLDVRTVAGLTKYAIRRGLTELDD